MVWIVWLLLCCGPAAIIYRKRRPPLKFFAITVAVSLGAYLLAGGFMGITGAQRSTAILTGQIFGFLGLVAMYAVSILANESVTKGKPPLW